MTAKDNLNAIRKLDYDIQQVNNRCDEYFDSATRATGRMEAERISGTGSRSRVEDCVCRKIDYERKNNLDARIDELADMRREARLIIARIECERFRQVLTLRYMQYRSWEWPWERVAKVMGVTVTHAHRLHGWALVAYERSTEI